jgi:hypothetical protein
MPRSQWPSRPNNATAANHFDPADQAGEDLAAAHGSLLHEARHLLSELGDATTRLGDAFEAAGFGAAAWESPEAQLRTLNDHMPKVRLEALLTRIAEFAADSGPAWLAGDGAALDAFTYEVRVLVGAIRPLRSLAQRQRQRITSFAGRRRPLERALGDRRVGTQLDRVARALDQLAELAPLLEPLSSPPAARLAQDTEPQRPGDRAATSSEFGSEAPDWLVRRLNGRGGMAPAGEKPSRWRGIRPFPRLPRARVMALGLAAALLVLVLSGVLALARMGLPLTGGNKPLTIGQVMATATALRRLSGTPSGTAGTPTAPVPAHLTVSPTSVTLPCGGNNATLTVSNTGEQLLTWRASVSGNATLSATSGSVGPHSSGTLTAHAPAGTHGRGAITFTSNGGSVTVAYKICH